MLKFIYLPNSENKNKHQNRHTFINVVQEKGAGGRDRGGGYEHGER